MLARVLRQRLARHAAFGGHHHQRAAAEQTHAHATSKLGEANCRTLLDAVTPSRPDCVASSPEMPLCGTTTPFGRPVEPEV
ncbi:hypothetical protein ACFQ0O_04875 [Saccharopolyspora spinosporotrichia]